MLILRPKTDIVLSNPKMTKNIFAIFFLGAAILKIPYEIFKEFFTKKKIYKSDIAQKVVGKFFFHRSKGDF